MASQIAHWFDETDQIIQLESFVGIFVYHKHTLR